MRYSFVATALLASSTLTLALPTASSLLSPLQDASLGLPSVAGKIFDSVGGWLGNSAHHVDDLARGTWKGMNVQKLMQDGVDYDVLTHPAHPEYRLRITTTKPSTETPQICDPNVKQISGYLDINENKHLFFWFFESRDKPSSDPLVLWLNGGPGCSSTTGLLFELGPCMINSDDKGKTANTTYNPYSWTEHANVLFLDQPVGVGYSYTDSGKVDNSPAAAQDVYAFLKLFTARYEKYRHNEFHISGESYAGTYLPHIANVIHTTDKMQDFSTEVAPIPKLNFKSVLIGNGLTEPAIQFGSVPEYACDSPYAVYQDPTGPECSSLRSKMERCQKLAEACYKLNNRLICVPATIACFNGLGQLQDLGLNLYDSRLKCDRSEDADGPLCYRQMGWIETYMNRPDVKKQLGAPASLEFKSCNMDINRDFFGQGDVMHHTSDLLKPIIEDGIRVLVYAGTRDMMCNFIGNEHWVDALETSFQSAFLNSSATPLIDTDKNEVGYVRSAGKGAGNVAFVAIYEAGHMVPQDQPLAALNMFERWLDNKPLAKGK